MTPRQRRRRDNLLYRLRRHGIRADTRSHTIYIPAGTDPWLHPQAARLHNEYNFQIQLTLL